MGRGVSAATTMIRVRAGIRGLLTVEPVPAAVLTAADEMIARDAPDQFVTAAALLVDPATGEMSLCNAGHVPVVVVHPDGSTEALERPGAACRWACRSDHADGGHRPPAARLGAGDGDGRGRRVPGHDIDHGIALLRERAAELRDGPLQQLVEALAALADASLRDDVTVVAARLR